jgi:hypothetical protein
VTFGLDSKLVVDNFNNNAIDDSEFGDIIKDCKNIFHLISQTFMLSLIGDKQIILLIILLE